MSEKNKELEYQKRDLAVHEDTERTRECKCYSPRTDIYETRDEVVVLTNLPDVDKNSIDITLKEHVLTINGYVEPDPMPGYDLSHVEYGTGDYQRKFTISRDIDQENIKATLKDGVLTLHLPKLSAASAQKIVVKSVE